MMSFLNLWTAYDENQSTNQFFIFSIAERVIIIIFELFSL